jgi:hypothetical protein
MKILYREFQRTVDVHPSVVWWNYWDIEHFLPVHKSYTDAKMLYEDEKMYVLQLTWRLPLFSFLKSSGICTTIKTGPYKLEDFQSTLFNIAVKTEIELKETSHNSTLVISRYKFFLHGWRKFLAPFMYRMMAVWNQRVWEEDLPLKLRRQKVLESGFVDFKGLPTNIKDRFIKEKLEQRLPVRRPKNSPINEYL